MTTDQKVIKTKVGLLELAKQLGNVADACRIMGYSRDSSTDSKSSTSRAAKRRCRRSVGAGRTIRIASRRGSKRRSSRWRSTSRRGARCASRMSSPKKASQFRRAASASSGSAMTLRRCGSV